MAIVLVSLAVLAPLQRASLDSRREREAELLFVGDQYRRALERYYIESPQAPEYPESLEALVEDARWPAARRPLRRLYPDPMTGRFDWGFELEGERIVGIYSRAPGEPLKKTGFPARYVEFGEADGYGKWVFRPKPAGAAPAASAPEGTEGIQGVQGDQGTSGSP